MVGGYRPNVAMVLVVACWWVGGDRPLAIGVLAALALLYRRIGGVIRIDLIEVTGWVVRALIVVDIMAVYRPAPPAHPPTCMHPTYG